MAAVVVYGCRDVQLIRVLYQSPTSISQAALLPLHVGKVGILEKKSCLMLHNNQ